MEKYVFGFWGCYFGTSVLMLGISAFAFSRSLRRISINAALATVGSAFFAFAFLGGFSSGDSDRDARLLAHVSVVISALLAYLLLYVLGILRQREVARRAGLALACVTALVLAGSWWLAPFRAQALGTAIACLIGLAALALSVRRALRGDRLAWVVVTGVFFMLLAIAGLGWIALHRSDAPWQLHALAATAATAYLVAMASVLWMRYAYLVELHQVMAHGPSYDPVTRMRSHGETSKMVGEAFRQYRDDPVPLGMIVVSIANLDVLGKLYGQSAVNHALFVCAGRLRREVPEYAETGRLADDSFLLLVPNCSNSGPLLALARAVHACLSRPVKLNTSFEAGSIGAKQTRWVAEIGVGVLRVYRPDARAASAVAMGRGMSRTAWSYPSRVAWYDEKSGEIVGMPLVSA